MRVVITGMGNQGIKRRFFLNKNEFISFVDPYKKEARFKKIEDIELCEYDTVFICTDEKSKLKLINFCIKNKKNFLIEKPFPKMTSKKLKVMIKKIIKNKIIAYVAYNLRFEKNIIKLKKYLKNLKKIYSIELEYSNGTAANVKKKKWKDKGLGVISDLSCHLVDLLIFLFGYRIILAKPLCLKNSFENNSIDHSLILLKQNKKIITIKNSYCSWKNHFNIDIISKYFNYKLFSLEKWGDAKLFQLKRKFPSGIPVFKNLSVLQRDKNVFQKEIIFYKKLLKEKNYNYIKKEFYINSFFNNLKFL
jgi:scyllo-inositol 2-dehydrogenase (NADP+)